ncbi:MAG TPA: hypothetical protein VJ874_02655 [Candidatus Thermoplasmatota archaeon]|nr:hypothetical protein [Candidatus Thermoplasmatota archaeon]
MHLAVVAAVALAFAFTGIVAAPAAEAAPPDLPPDHSGCGYFHWHNGNIVQGTPPGYHYHHCF